MREKPGCETGGFRPGIRFVGWVSRFVFSVGSSFLSFDKSFLLGGLLFLSFLFLLPFFYLFFSFFIFLIFFLDFINLDFCQFTSHLFSGLRRHRVLVLSVHFCSIPAPV